MKTKEEIRINPFNVIKVAQRKYNNTLLYIQIELTDQEDDLFLLPPSQGMRIGKKGSIYKYDDHNRRRFNDLIANFGKTDVLIPDHTKAIEFGSYEELLNEIIRD